MQPLLVRFTYLLRGTPSPHPSIFTMHDKSRRTFLTGTAAATASLVGSRAASAAPSIDAPENTAAVLVAFSALAGTGLTPEEIGKSRSYLLGAYREFDARLRPLEFADSLAPPVSFAAVKRP
jgi:hypothetical protein